MTTTPHGQVPEALTYERGRAIMEGERNASLDAYSRVVLLTSTEVRLYETAFTNGWNRCAAIRTQPPASPTPPAEQQAQPGAVGRTGCTAGTDEECTRRGCATSCPAQQAAPKAAPATQQAGDVVAYLDVGAGGYLDLGSELSEDALQQLPKGRHALVIAGTYGIDGYVAAPQPSPTTKPAPQQEAQEPMATLHCNDVGYVWARATGVGKRMRFEQPLNLYAAPQPSPDCHHRPPCDECAAIAAQRGNK